jgi:acetyl-CoA acetyltransferase
VRQQGQPAIVGIGATEFSKASGRTELRLAVEAVAAALADCGLRPSDVDGLVTFDMDTSPVTEVARYTGMDEIRFFPSTGFGGGGSCSTIELAAMAVTAGTASTVVAYRAFNERSGSRFGQARSVAAQTPPTADHVTRSWTYPFGLMTPASVWAMAARRYMHEYGATSADFGRISVLERQHASTNPAAWFYGRPITLEDHQKSRWIAEPLRLLDCCQETDGGIALVVTSPDRAADLPQRPVSVAAAASGFSRDQQIMTSYSRGRITDTPEMAAVGARLWKQCGLGPADMHAAMLYDHFTPSVLFQLEALGFCLPGEGAEFVASGALAMDGALPLNPHGGQIGEGYMHGMNAITEAVRQLRGTAANQVADPQNILVTAGTAIPTSALILSRAG